MTIRAIIWDFGGVLVRTEDYSGREHLAQWLGKSRLELEDLVFSSESGQHAQRGEISEIEHWENVRRILRLTQEELGYFQLHFWRGDKLDLELVAYIRNLNNLVKTGLLSNNFSGLRDAMTTTWKIDDLFQSIIISAEVKMLKPDPAIFRLSLDELKIDAGEAVFIDDFKHNLVGARQVGLKVIHFKNTEQVQTEIAAILGPGSR